MKTGNLFTGDSPEVKLRREGPSVSSVLSAVASIASIAAAVIAISGIAQPWLVALLVVFIVLVMGVLVWRPIANLIGSLVQRRQRMRLGRELVNQALGIASQLHEQMNIMRSDSLGTNLFGLNSRGIFGDYSAPHPARLSFAVKGLAELMRHSGYRHETVTALLQSFDMLFAVYNDLYVLVPTAKAKSTADKISEFDKDQIKKSLFRYSLLVEEHRHLCDKANEMFGLNLGVWCHELPVSL
ncbi:MAG: hypothetical protein Q7T26_02200 [Dehalococcoidia bacterium]|nr:hypothetical protein [Dehalococcoidia bacterium]